MITNAPLTPAALDSLEQTLQKYLNIPASYSTKEPAKRDLLDLLLKHSEELVACARNANNPELRTSEKSC